ncbi:hypothetical protein E4J66_06175 [Actinomyces viscosus]|nr:hypothetical protein E4J66_06175 [Actinomyces viscosus]
MSGRCLPGWLWPTAGNSLPMPASVHELRGHSYMRHRASFAGIPYESRRGPARQGGRGGR